MLPRAHPLPTCPTDTTYLAQRCSRTSTHGRPTSSGLALPPADVDPTLPFEERRKTLQAHYGFDCKCMKCVTEQRKELKNRMHQRDAYMQAQRR